MKKLILFLTFLFSFSSSAENLIKVAIIDTGLKTEFRSKVPLCNSGHKDFTGEGFNDFIGHGTNVTGLITQGVQDLNYCVILIKAYSFRTHKFNQYVPEALEYSLTQNVQIINLSGGGQDPIEKERIAILKLLSQNVTIVVAAGNDQANFDEKCNYYPACYDSRIRVIGSFADSSNYGTQVDVYLNGTDQIGFGIKMSGTSQATALYTNKILKELAKEAKVK